MFSDWAWTERFSGLTVDKLRSWTDREHGLSEVADRSRSRTGRGRGQVEVADRSRSRTGQGRGQVRDSSWKCPRPRTLRGHCADIAADIAADRAWTFRVFFVDIRTLRLQGVRRPLSNP